MTDSEIIKALEIHINEFDKTGVSVDNNRLDKLALDLINRQQAEIERLKKILSEEEEKYKLCAKRFYKVGVKDFAEKLKSTYFIDSERLCCQVDKVFKEMVGDTE